MKRSRKKLSEPLMMVIVYSVERRQPGCVLLQAAMGGSVPSRLFNDLFPPETWIVGEGADSLRLYKVTEEELRIVAAKTLKRR